MYASARWHSIGRPVIYTATHLSLAVLEVLVHTDPDLIPDDHVWSEIDVPDDLTVSTVDVQSLPRGWEAPDYEGCRPLGDAWLQDKTHACLQVPSAIVPREHNLLINPAHPDATRIALVAQEPFAFDARLFPRSERRGSR